MEQARDPEVAFFSMEFAVRPDLPVYAGGLGVLAGDMLKAASDRGFAMVGVGLLFAEGYFRQQLRAGRQQIRYRARAAASLPVQRAVGRDGIPLRVAMRIDGREVWLRAFSLQMGSATLYLLDADDRDNRSEDRWITRRLYCADPRVRLRQELVLGVGGYRLLDALGIRAPVLHMNEGHAAFALLERARLFAQREHCSFAAALAATKPGNLFTTHTSVGAGFDVFPAREVANALLGPAGALEGTELDEESLSALGAMPDSARDQFNMAALAIRGSERINAASRAHQTASQALFAPLFPELARDRVPVSHVTNGVHLPSWVAPASASLWCQAYGGDWWRGSGELGRFSAQISDERLWQTRDIQRRALCAYVHERTQRTRERLVASLSDGALTMAFARRFTGYKRPGLLLSDPARLTRLLSAESRPVQLILAGKAHPADKEGQMWIRNWLAFAESEQARGRVVFLADYDLACASELVRGADLWLNTPLPPWEACGTSGMKVLANGGLNLSARDGWWLEAQDPALGFSFGGAAGDDHAADADALFTTLEREVVPSFYERDGAGLPRRWLERMRQSMGRLTLRYGADRMLGKYIAQLYQPAALDIGAALAGRTRDRPSVHYAPRAPERGEMPPLEPAARALEGEL